MLCGCVAQESVAPDFVYCLRGNIGEKRARRLSSGGPPLDNPSALFANLSGLLGSYILVSYIFCLLCWRMYVPWGEGC